MERTIQGLESSGDIVKFVGDEMKKYLLKKQVFFKKLFLCFNLHKMLYKPSLQKC